MNNIDPIIDEAKKEGFKRTNRYSTDIFFVKGKQQVLLRKTLLRDQIPKIMELSTKSSELYDRGVNLTRTLAYRFDKHSKNLEWTNAYIYQDMAIDRDMQHTIFDDGLRKQLANEPQFVFDKYISDYMIIDKDLGQIDDNFNNLFYISGKITFIDLHIGRFSEAKITAKYAADEFIKNMPYIENDKDIEIIKAKMSQAANNYSYE